MGVKIFVSRFEGRVRMKSNVKVGGLVEKICGGVFFAVGLGMLIGAVAVFISNQNFKQTAREIEAVIADISTHYDSDGESHYDVWVTYEVEGREYTEEISFYSSGMYEGKVMDILVDRDYPTRIRSVSGSIFVVAILGGMGLTFALAGGCTLMVPIRRKAKMKTMIESGYYVYATVTGGFMCYNYTVNNRHPYKLECKYEDVFSGVTHMFTSEHIWADPQPYVGREIKVHCNRDFSGDYYVDIDSLHMCM